MATKKLKPKWTKEIIKAKLLTSDEAVMRGLLRIHSFQTPDEQTSGAAVYDNGMGFNGSDAWFLSEMVVKMKHYGKLTPGQIEVTRKAMLKYAGQLARYANSVEQDKTERPITAADLHLVDPS